MDVERPYPAIIKLNTCHFQPNELRDSLYDTYSLAQINYLKNANGHDRKNNAKNIIV